MEDPVSNEFSLFMRGQESHLLTRKEEIELGSLALFYWDERARQKLIESNVRLVHSIARKYKGRGVHFFDLVQEGNIGLIGAVDSYNPFEGAKFSTYATPKIKAKVRRAIATNGVKSIRPAFHIFSLIPSLKRYISWCDENGVRPERDDFYDSLNRELKTKISPKTFEGVIRFVRVLFPDSDVPYEAASDISTARDGRVGRSVDIVVSEEEMGLLKDVFEGARESGLTDVQRDVLLKKYFRGMKYAQIGEEMGMTGTGVLHIAKRARQNLVRYLERRARES